MTLQEALVIVLELAQQNAIKEEDNPEEWDRQQQAFIELEAYIGLES